MVACATSRQIASCFVTPYLNFLTHGQSGPSAVEFALRSFHFVSFRISFEDSRELDSAKKRVSLFPCIPFLMQYRDRHGAFERNGKKAKRAESPSEVARNQSICLVRVSYAFRESGVRRNARVYVEEGAE